MRILDDKSLSVATSLPLLTESEAIDRLALGDRPNPVGAIRWLVRTKKLRAVRIGRGILRYHPDDVQSFIESARV